MELLTNDWKPVCLLFVAPQLAATLTQPQWNYIFFINGYYMNFTGVTCQ